MANRVCEILDITYPIIQGPMAWITSAELVAAVSNAGGLGTLGTNAGQTEVSEDPETVYQRMCAEIIKTRELTDKPFALNYILPVPEMEDDETANMYSRALLRSAIDQDVKVIVAVGAPIEKEIRGLKEHGFTVVYRDDTPTIESAQKAESYGADIIVATGFDEGGAIPGKEIGTFTIVPIIADAVDVPVMAAGGIVEGRGFRAAMALGAEGVFCGTAFITSTECFASDIAKQDIIDHESSDLILYRALPSYWRSTPHRLAKQLGEKSTQGTPLPDMYGMMGGTGSLHVAQLEGKLDEGINSVNSAISLIKAVRPCEEIIQEMVAGSDY